MKHAAKMLAVAVLLLWAGLLGVVFLVVAAATAVEAFGLRFYQEQTEEDG